MFADVFLDWSALFNCFKGLTSAPHIHQYLMSIRFENQIKIVRVKNSNRFSVFPVANICSTLICDTSSCILSVMFLCLKVSTSLFASAEEDNDILKQKGETGNSFLLPYLHGLSNFVDWNLGGGLVFFPQLPHI